MSEGVGGGVRGAAPEAPGPEDPRASFTLTILADFGAEPPAAAELRRVEAGEFQALFARLRPRLDLRTPDLVTGAPREISWSATLGSIRDFDPENLLGRFPPTAPLLAWRQRLIEAARAGAGIPALLEAFDELWPDVPSSPPGVTPRAAVAQPSRPAPAADDFLALVDLPGTAPPAAGAALPGAPAAPLGLRDRLRLLLGMTTPWEARLRQARTAVDEALGRQLEAILHDPALRDREAAWRSLWAIVERADLRRGDLRLFVLPASRAEVAEALERLLLWHEEGGGRTAPGGAILVDHAVGPDEDSARILAAAARLAAALGARLFLPTDASLLARGGDQATARPAPIADLASSESLAQIREAGAAARAAGADLVLTCNRFLFRAPYGPEEAPVLLGAYREKVASPDGPFASAVWLAGRALTETVRRAGPESARTLDVARVERLAMRPLGRPDDPDHLLPLEFLLSVPEARLLLEAGLAPVTCDLDEDQALLRGIGGAAAAPDARAQETAPRDAGSPSASLSARFTIQTRPPETASRDKGPRDTEEETPG